VHALGQVAAFSTEAPIPTLGFVRGLNTALPRSIAIVSCEDVAAGFEPRRWSRGKHYRYQIWNREARAALLDRYAWHVHPPLDDAAMRAAAAHLVGEHDFSAFRAADCDRRNPVRILRRLDVARDGDLITIDVEGTAFLKHMVRVIVGTLADVGRGKKTPAEVAAIIAGKERKRAGRTAPAHGLTMVRVLLGDGPPTGPPAADDASGPSTDDDD
jgi:tRNA pseudouridine38-40 synthase